MVLLASLARTKASIGFRLLEPVRTIGGAVRRKGAKDQTTEAVAPSAGQLAPESIHSFSTAISAAGNGGPAGGMRSLAFPLTIAWSLLPALSPGLITRKAASRRSNLRLL